MQSIAQLATQDHQTFDNSKRRITAGITTAKQFSKNKTTSSVNREKEGEIQSERRRKKLQGEIARRRERWREREGDRERQKVIHFTGNHI